MPVGRTRLLLLAAPFVFLYLGRSGVTFRIVHGHELARNRTTPNFSTVFLTSHIGLPCDASRQNIERTAPAAFTMNARNQHSALGLEKGGLPGNFFFVSVLPQDIAKG